MITKEQLVPVMYKVFNTDIVIPFDFIESNKWGVIKETDDLAEYLTLDGKWSDEDTDEAFIFNSLEKALEALNKVLTPVLPGNIDIIGDGVS